MIRIVNVTHKAIRDVSLELSERRVGVIGSNGSGKSTLARLLNGLNIPESGDVFVDEFNTRTHRRDVIKRVGFIFQSPDQQIVMPTPEEDIGFGLRNVGLSKLEVEAEVTKVLSDHGMEHLRGRNIYDLSGGQKQLLAIAGVLAMRPKYIVFDEPTTLLDLKNKRRIRALIEDIEQTAIVFTHDLEMLRCFDRIIVLDFGRVVYDGSYEAAIEAYLTCLS